MGTFHTKTNDNWDLVDAGEYLLKLLVSFMILLFVGSCGDGGSISRAPSREMATVDLEGVYEFVSEKTTVTKPEPGYEQNTSDQWSGMWFFRNRHYSQTMMQKRREWPPFPRNIRELGYQSSAGEYEIKGNLIVLRPILSLNPLNLIQSKTLEFELEGDMLTLTETMTPRLENLTEGTRVTLLRRVN